MHHVVLIEYAGSISSRHDGILRRRLRNCPAKRKCAGRNGTKQSSQERRPIHETSRDGAVVTLAGERIKVSIGIQAPRKMGAGATKSALEHSIRSSVGSSSKMDTVVKGVLSVRSVADAVELPPASEWIEGLMCSSCDCLVNSNYVMCVKEGHLTCNWCCSNKNPLCQFSVDNAEARESSVETTSSDSDSTTLEGSSLKRDTDEDSESQSEESEGAGSAVTGVVGQVGNFNELTGSETDDDERWKFMLDGKLDDPSLQKSVCGGQLVRQRHVFVDQLLNKVELFCPNWRNGCPEAKLTVGKVGWHCKEKCQHKVYKRPIGGRKALLQ